MVNIINVVCADDGLLIVNAVRDGPAGSGEANDNRVQRALRSVGGGFACFNVEGHITAIADEAVSDYVAAAVNAVDMSVSPVDAWEKIEVAARFKDSVPEILVEERTHDNARVGDATQHLIFRRRGSEINLGEPAALPPEVAAHHDERVVHCLGGAKERRRGIDDLELSGMVEQKSVDGVRAGFKKSHDVSAVIYAHYGGVQGAGNVDGGELFVDKFETASAARTGKAAVAVRPLLVEAHDFSEIVDPCCVCGE